MRKITILLFVIVLVSFFIASIAHAQAAVPVVQTFKDATSTSVIVNLPEGFNGSVTTTYDGNQFNTTYSTSSITFASSTSTPMADEQLPKIEADIQAQEKAEENAMNNFFAEQQALFRQMWSDAGLS